MKRERIRKIIGLILFIGIAALPFISVTEMIGMEKFLDSFEHPDSYLFLKNDDVITGIKTNADDYIIIQKTNHPEFEIQENDKLMYFNIQGEISCEEVKYISGIGTFKRYYLNSEYENYEETIYEGQVIGKVIKQIDNNFWNELSIKIWDISIENFNIHSTL